MQPMKIAADSQQRQGRTLNYLADADDGLAIEPVRHVPHHQREQEHGQKLHQPNHTQGKRAVGQRVHLPADRNRRHLERYRRADPGKPEAHILWLTED
jgi:hypothetical protein